MKINLDGKPRVIISGNENLHDYYAWPSVARLKNGKLAAASSGMRLAHVCPFGKAVMAVSEDQGETYTLPMPVIDTVLDDRDSGLCPFGKSGLIFTSFNNTVAFQRGNALKVFKEDITVKRKAYVDAYLDLISEEEEKRDVGSNFRISHDNGITFGEIHKSPVTSPHGPAELSDGTILWVGRTFNSAEAFKGSEDKIKAYTVDTETGKMEYRGEIEGVYDDGDKVLSCEPHTVELPTGRLVCHIRVQRHDKQRLYTTYQSVSDDKGFTWSKPVPVLSRTGGAPAHLLVHSSGTLICSYGYREPEPCFGVRVMFSDDGGESWYGDTAIYENPLTPDLGYPETVELADTSLATVFYAHPVKDGPAKILQQKWRFEK